MTRDALEIFEERFGTIEDWDGDRNAYYAALGAFVVGWIERGKEEKEETKEIESDNVS